MPSFDIDEDIIAGIIALTIIVGGYSLIAQGHDGYVAAVMTLVTGYYFGKKGRINS